MFVSTHLILLARGTSQRARTEKIYIEIKKKKKKESGNIGEIRTKIISQTTWLVTFDHNPIEKDENYDISPNGVSLSQRFCKKTEN